MPTARRVRIEVTDEAPSGAAAETAAVRLIALLPAGWTARLLGCTATSATLLVTPSAELSADGVAAAVDGILRRPPLRGWARTRLPGDVTGASA
ncbi:hypothetical protein [Streptomyces sp. Tu 3180]|uniref:hypothetical protein n=1 Tax=Streptomyces sp. Tu 3180 TaxID=2682611 RepID=UPI00135867B1|nr:hypothetical protein [Streptomyces sp. Tu 3180]KAF3466044.1 hypothetical protein GL259_18020 [Streptomyces sp. Tu 3180]